MWDEHVKLNEHRVYRALEWLKNKNSYMKKERKVRLTPSEKRKTYDVQTEQKKSTFAFFLENLGSLTTFFCLIHVLNKRMRKRFACSEKTKKSYRQSVSALLMF